MTAKATKRKPAKRATEATKTDKVERTTESKQNVLTTEDTKFSNKVAVNFILLCKQSAGQQRICLEAEYKRLGVGLVTAASTDSESAEAKRLFIAVTESARAECKLVCTKQKLTAEDTKDYLDRLSNCNTRIRQSWGIPDLRNRGGGEARSVEVKRDSVVHDVLTQVCRLALVRIKGMTAERLALELDNFAGNCEAILDGIVRSSKTSAEAENKRIAEDVEAVA